MLVILSRAHVLCKPASSLRGWGQAGDQSPYQNTTLTLNPDEFLINTKVLESNIHLVERKGKFIVFLHPKTVERY